MKFLILFACIAAASAVSTFYPFKHEFGVDKYHKDYPVYEKEFYPHKYGKDYYGKDYYGKDFYGKDFYGKDFYGKHFYGKDYYGKDFYPKDYTYGKDYFYGKHFDFDGFLKKDISLVKKNFVFFFYKHLLEIVDNFKTHYGSYLVDFESMPMDKFELPMYCTKLNGMMRWMMTMNIDFTQYDIHYFDYFMMCKMYDYLMFMKYYWANFNMDVMYRDYDMIKGFYGLIGDHGYGLHKYYGDIFGHGLEHGVVTPYKGYYEHDYKYPIYGKEFVHHY